MSTPAAREEEVVATTALEGAEAAATETGSETASGPAAVPGMFGLRADLLAAQIINFLIVLIVLWRFAYRPIMKMLEEREAKIEKSVKDAEAIESRVREFEVEREALLAAARKDAQEIVTKAMAQSEERKNEMVEASKREVERVIAKGKQQLVVDKETMLREVRKDIVDIAVKAAARILHEGISEQKSESLAEEVVRKMT